MHCGSDTGQARLTTDEFKAEGDTVVAAVAVAAGAAGETGTFRYASPG